MKKTIFLVVIIFLATLTVAAQKGKATTNTNNPINVMVGTWKGDMGGKSVTVVIEKIMNNTITGYNIIGTNKRSLKGTFSKGNWDESCSIAYDVVLAEPGDDKWDGVYKIKFIGYNAKETADGIECVGKFIGAEANGTWKSNNGKLKKELQLSKS
jgi:hypothetical protein